METERQIRELKKRWLTTTNHPVVRGRCLAVDYDSEGHTRKEARHTIGRETGACLTAAIRKTTAIMESKF